MRKNQPWMYGVVHIGSEKLTLQIAQFSTLEDIQIIEQASREMPLGEETFRNGEISFATVYELCEVLKGYRRMLHEYDVADFDVYATTAIREAKNRRFIIDQIQVKTGFEAKVADVPQEIYYKYVALFRTVREMGGLPKNGAALFVDISSGGLGITLFERECIHYQQNIHIGALRIKESFEKNQRDSAHFHQALTEYIFSTIEPVKDALAGHNIKTLIVSGTETELIERMLAHSGTQAGLVASPTDFQTVYQIAKSHNIMQLIKKFAISEQKAEMVLPVIVLTDQILALTEAESILFPRVHFTSGILALKACEKTNHPYAGEMDNQVVSLTHSLARKYSYDPRHSRKVEELALQLFDVLQKVHGLGARERFLLKLCSILHDIGKYVSLRRHYFYSYRLILSSDILGISELDKQIMANIAHYHSKGVPSDNDGNFVELPERQKVVVAKLTAIMRLADALDRSHRSKVGECAITIKSDTLQIQVRVQEDFSLEEWTFADKAPFFEEVFGMRVMLETEAWGNYV